MKRYLLNGAIFLAIVLSLGTAAFAQIKTVGYKAAAVDEERVKAAADFAVSNRQETNSEQEGLTLETIDKAETQIVAGTNFRLCLTVKLQDETQQVQVIVYENLKREYSLTSWVVEDCADNSNN